MKTKLLLLIAGLLICTVQAQEMKWKGEICRFFSWQADGIRQ